MTKRCLSGVIKAGAKQTHKIIDECLLSLRPLICACVFAVNPMVDVLQTAKHYGASKFVEMVEQAGLADRFKRQGPFTLFAPIDSAFEVKEKNENTAHLHF
jgi:uncharacterized surface protein with fasciclin (FAS1) repeats